MKISPSKEIRSIIVFLFIAVLIVSFLILSIGSPFGSILFMCIGGIVIVRYTIAFGKCITFSQNGICLEFIGLTKFYKWENIKSKGYFNCEKSIGYKSSYNSGAEFFLSKNSRPQWLMPDEYAMIFHPWSYVFVYFTPQNTNDIKTKFPPIYEIQDDFFQTTMMTWDVSI